MAPSPQKDNSTLRRKVALRLELLRELQAAPVVLETHGGLGTLWRYCYQDVADGVVLEKDPVKAAVLGRQRPGWAVYQADCIAALAAGVGAHLPINFVDIDPYGSPWPVFDALFGSVRPWPDRLAVAVNDGLRHKLKTGSGWHVEALESVVDRYGAEVLYDDYLAICRELVEEKAAQAGYSLRRWTGYYCGHSQAMTHYAAILTRSGGVS